MTITTRTSPTKQLAPASDLRESLSLCHDPRWYSPEVVLGAQGGYAELTSRADVFCFGTLLHELFNSGAPPFSALSASQLRDHIAMHGSYPEMNQQTQLQGPLDETIRAIQIRCHSPTPEDRPLCSELVTLITNIIHGNEQWQYPRSKLTKLEPLGAGQFGEVLKMIADGIGDGLDPTIVAVKSAIITSTNPAVVSQTRADFMAEIEVMKKIQHPNLVALLGVCVETEPLLMIIEYLPGGALDSWLRSAAGASVTQLSRLAIVLQVAVGMSALHRFGIVHRDLAARNVLIDVALRIKVADFGLAREISSAKHHSQHQHSGADYYYKHETEVSSGQTDDGCV